jgi:IS1 family transposase
MRERSSIGPMNRLSTEKRAQILSMLVEGNSVRATSRIAGVAINTIQKLLLDIGAACAEYQDQALRDLPCKTIEADEIWSFVGSKQKNVPASHEDDPNYGDVWTWTALDADSKLIVSWYVGGRAFDDCMAFMEDLKGRLAGPIQLTTDGHQAYVAPVGLNFKQDIDWAQIQKTYRADHSGARRYSPQVCAGIKTRVLKGDPDPAKISTSYVERQNLTMRMSMRRFTRLTNGFSKKLDNHMAAIALHFLHYNFARPHTTLAGPYPQTPAMAAGVADHVWTMTEIAALLTTSLRLHRGSLERSAVPLRRP